MVWDAFGAGVLVTGLQYLLIREEKAGGSASVTDCNTWAEMESEERVGDSFEVLELSLRG
jgi:hypothetical protein